MIVEIGKEMLKRLGYSVTTRTSSIEALELFRMKPIEFNLVITDQTMPQMTGTDLAKEILRIRANNPDHPVHRLQPCRHSRKGACPGSANS